MTIWRKKRMPLAEWTAVQERFGELQVAHRGDPDLALFVSGPAHEDEQEIFMTGPGIEAIERLSGGGWEDSGPPQGNHVSLLVGTSDSWERFGIVQPDA